MENSSVLDNSNNGSSFKEKKPKRKFDKIMTDPNFAG